MIEARRLKNVVIFLQAILSFVLSRKIIEEIFNERLHFFVLHSTGASEQIILNKLKKFYVIQPLLFSSINSGKSL